jgi:hypothetical protein
MRLWERGYKRPSIRAATDEVTRLMELTVLNGDIEEFKAMLADFGLEEGSPRYVAALNAWLEKRREKQSL